MSTTDDKQSLFQNPNAGEELTDEVDYLKMILTARVYDIAIESPLQKGINLSKRTKNTILYKREDLQPVFSFKCRGAVNMMAHLSEEEKAGGVICCSAGNHAQGVAMAASNMGVTATIVMPRGAPPIKVAAVERMGAKVILHGDDFQEAKTECERLAKEQNLPIIPPYDNPYIIAGQGTIALEILQQ
jgi:threonine dehydratase